MGSEERHNESFQELEVQKGHSSLCILNDTAHEDQLCKVALKLQSSDYFRFNAYIMGRNSFFFSAQVTLLTLFIHCSREIFREMQGRTAVL